MGAGMCVIYLIHFTNLSISLSLRQIICLCTKTERARVVFFFLYFFYFTKGGLLALTFWGGMLSPFSKIFRRDG